MNWVAVTAFLLGFATSAAAQGLRFHSWIDDNGVIHHSNVDPRHLRSDGGLRDSIWRDRNPDVAIASPERPPRLSTYSEPRVRRAMPMITAEAAILELQQRDSERLDALSDDSKESRRMSALRLALLEISREVRELERRPRARRQLRAARQRQRELREMLAEATHSTWRDRNLDVAISSPERPPRVSTYSEPRVRRAMPMTTAEAATLELQQRRSGLLDALSDDSKESRRMSTLRLALFEISREVRELERRPRARRQLRAARQRQRELRETLAEATQRELVEPVP